MSRSRALRNGWRSLWRIWRLLRDQRVPSWLKMVPFLALIYVLSPIDLLPDLTIPGISALDDLILILLAFRMLLDWAPMEDQRMSSDREDVIEASYRVLEE